MDKTPDLKMIPLTDLIPTTDNPRVIRKDDPAIQELAQSIKERGVLEPLLARPDPINIGAFDLRAGARRLAAAQIAGLKEIPVIVREMDDAEALEVTVTENLQREDLTPLEEGRGVQTLLDGGWEVKAIAAHLGKRPEWVIRRARLAKLSKKWVNEVEGPKGRAKKWSATHLEIIARLDPVVQDIVLERFKYDLARNDIPDLKDVLHKVGDLTRELSKALWKKDDVTLLPKVGACVECPKRSAANLGLFDDFDAPPEKIKRGDRCLDPECWKLKAQAHIKRIHKELEQEHGKILLTATDGHHHDEKDIISEYHVDHCKKADKGAKPCLVLYGDNAGQWFWGRTEREAAKDRSKATRSKEGSGNAAHGTTDDPDERKKRAREFANAQLALSLAKHLVNGWKEHLPLVNCLRAITDDLMEGGPMYGSTGAREWLSAQPPACDSKRLTDLMIKSSAFALFDSWQNDGKKPDVPKVVAEKAAKTFVIHREFLESHLRANIYHIAKELKIEVGAGAKKEYLIEAILKAKLLAGTLTKELKKAFDVKQGLNSGKLFCAF